MKRAPYKHKIKLSSKVSPCPPRGWGLAYQGRGAGARAFDDGGRQRVPSILRRAVVVSLSNHQDSIWIHLPWRAAPGTCTPSAALLAHLPWRAMPGGQVALRIPGTHLPWRAMPGAPRMRGRWLR
jgi:hypothetical protein